ncbi:MAG: phospholipase D-like domain-containing protein [Candidatus Micrarchaeota archaeon]
MKRFLLFGLFLSIGFLAGFVFPHNCVVLGSEVQSVFSPGALNTLLAFVYSAQESIDVELYQFSNPELMQALAEEASKGVLVRVVLEPRVEGNLETGKYLASKGIEVKWASLEYTNTHSKFAVVDEKRVLVGSINWSRRAGSTNREAGVIITDEGIARDFLLVFAQDWFKAQAFIG